MAADHVDDFARMAARAAIYREDDRRAHPAAGELDELGAVEKVIRSRRSASAYAASFALIRNGTSPSLPRRHQQGRGRDSPSCSSAYLEDQGALACLPTKIGASARGRICGVGARAARPGRNDARHLSRRAILPFVEALGDDTSAYDAAAIRTYMLGRAGTVSVERTERHCRRHPRVPALPDRDRASVHRDWITPCRMPRGGGSPRRRASCPMPISRGSSLRATASGGCATAPSSCCSPGSACGRARWRDLSFDDIDWRQGSIRLPAKAGAKSCCRSPRRSATRSSPISSADGRRSRHARCSSPNMRRCGRSTASPSNAS